MDLALSPDEIAFRDEVRAFLDVHLTPELRAAGRAQTSVFSNIADSLPWQKILAARGWAAPPWPVEHGGPGWNDMQRYIFAAECAATGAPSLAPMGLRMVAPVIMRYGSEAQKAHYLPRILSGEDYWCQGYSEPGAGSDLAALALRADSDGDDYILNGSKLWTTHAQWATHMFALIRTDSSGRPQQGVTFLLLEMTRPGITVAPIITLAGDHEINQVFFENVRVPKSGRLGVENEGWTVAKALLEFERGGGSAPGLKVALQRLRALAADAPPGGAPLLEDPAFRRRLAELEVEIEAIEITEHRVLSAVTSGQSPGALSSLLKIQGTEAMQKVDELAIQAAAPFAQVVQPLRASNDPVGPAAALTAMPRYLNNRAASIYGGSNEIQRNIIARGILGIPT